MKGFLRNRDCELCIELRKVCAASSILSNALHGKPYPVLLLRDRIVPNPPRLQVNVRDAKSNCSIPNIMPLNVGLTVDLWNLFEGLARPSAAGKYNKTINHVRMSIPVLKYMVLASLSRSPCHSLS